MMIIRQCESDDEGAVYVLICELEGMELDRGDFERVYCGKLTDGQCRCLVGEEDGAVVAFIGLNVREMFNCAARIMTVDELIVHEPFRGHGYGHQMMDEAVRLARESHCYRIELTSHFRRERAHEFYEGYGFVRLAYKFCLGV